MNDFEVRRARDDELERVVRLRWLWTLERGQDPGDEQRYVRDASAWAREHSQTHLPHVAIGPDGAVLGMAWLALTPRVATITSLHRVSGDLQSCYVLPEARRAGVGSALVAAVLATARELGAEHVTVHATDDGARLYERGGFRVDPLLLWADLRT